MLRRCLVQVDVVASREHASITASCGFCQRVLPAPGLNDNIFGGIGLQYFVPSFHDFLVAGDDLLDLGCEKHLQSPTVFNRMRSHELLNARIGLPLLDIALISSRVKVGIGEEGSHLPDKSSEKFVRAFACWIHCRTMGGILTAGQVGVAQKPRCRVARHIKLWNHSDTTVASGRDDLPDFVLCVIKTAGALFLQPWKFLTFHVEALIVRETPMEDI